MQKVKNVKDLTDLGLDACIYFIDKPLLQSWFPGVKTKEYVTTDQMLKAFDTQKCGAVILNGVDYASVAGNRAHCNKEMVGTALIPNYASWVTNFDSPCIKAPLTAVHNHHCA